MASDPPSGGLTRRIKETRPLALKRTDNKTICAVTAKALNPAVVDHIHSSQRGFVSKRHFVQNALDIDTHSRIDAFKCMHSRNNPSFESNLPNHSISELACCALFDFASAFPSIYIEWLFLVLSFINAPEGAITIIKTYV